MRNRARNVLTSLAPSTPSAQKLSARVVHDLAMHVIRTQTSTPFMLPTEPDLCEQLQVSRTVLREAIRTLQAKGLVSVAHGQGMLGLPREKWNHLDSDVLNWQCEVGVDEHFVTSLYEVRQIFEPAAAAWAARRASDADVERLQASYDRMTQALTDPNEFIKADLEFHNIIVSSCGNEILAQFAYSITAALRAGRDISIRVPSGWAESCALHKLVLDAIRDRDPEGAAASILVIVTKAIRDIRFVLDSRVRSVESVSNDGSTRIDTQ
jgi:GntR family galactonate operon transcriptional repressor